MTIMMKTPKVSRRGFVIGSAAAGGGLAIGFSIAGMARSLAAARRRQLPANEVGIWVAIKPNDDVIVRMARSEMGQGTLTGLAQLVAEELEADWKKVKWEYITPGESLAKQARLGRLRHRRQPRHPRCRTTTCAAAAPSRARC